ncbi:RecQ family ATP-dependent DNA helicase [Cerasicoccus fimbriatus]|uniref:RecQ family ATP-dependent DNA helicase n=1 Tax=Cerasicoccus fimbriatus TaxID=3014554 RepID=UPI0022B4086D|nr:RecQ family ATP-dependent DNA helicase [Cerasicoccus sp. TK19100]
MTPAEGLKKHFGFEQFREPQDEIVASILGGRDTLVIMPTGGGKSLCYQLPALMLPGVTLVISPLIALMKDQVDALNNRGIAAAMINSSQSWDEQRACLDDLRRGELKLVYVAPERFRAQSFIDSLKGVKISLFAVDEAHCISQWGHDFRPDYQRLGEALEKIGHPTCAAFTATATPEVREDIAANLKLRQPATFVSGFGRDNLSFAIKQIDKRKDKIKRVRQLIDNNGVGIIYCARRKSVEEVSSLLREEFVEHVIYHGGMTPNERDAAQDRFVRGAVPIAVATNAFGMGIDRADIRFVCHYEMPGSIEAYYQEAGRAGRDGKPAYCEMLFCYADKTTQEFFIEGANPTLSLIHSIYSVMQRSANEQAEAFLSIEEICDTLPGKVNGMAVSSALSQLRRAGVIERFDVPGSRLRGTRIVKQARTAGDLGLDARALLIKRQRDEDKLRRLIQFAYAKSCRQQWILEYFEDADAAECGQCDRCRHRGGDVKPVDDEQALIVKKALSGVARMSDRQGRHQWRARYGRDRVVKCLTGSQAKTILEPGLDKLSTHGLLKKHGTEFVSKLLDELENSGYLTVTDGEYPLLELTETGSKVMFGETMPRLSWPELETAPHAEPDDALYEQLVKLRNEMRRKRGNPPAYTIFPNTVLQQMAALKPATAEEAMSIKGIGPGKARSILPPFLEIINGSIPEVATA